MAVECCWVSGWPCIGGLGYIHCLHPGGYEKYMKTLLEATFIPFISGFISTVFISVVYLVLTLS
jgi:hypothetical protein